jgi:protein-S-isoprenylcysteine O-methyltransferase Ste14
MSSRKKKSAQPAPTSAAPATAPGQTSISNLDFAERAGVLAFYVWFFWHYGGAFLKAVEQGRDTEWAVLPLIAESVTVFFLLIRRPAHTIAPSPLAWLLALVPTVLPLLVEYSGGGYFAGQPILLAGIASAIIVKIALGRSFGLVAANRGLQVAGPYRLIRHPMYFCYLLNHVGTWLLNPTVWNLGVYGVTWTLQIARIFIEEKHLSQDPAYREYRKVVRYRLIPGIF